MRILPLGGAGEVGASASVVEIGGCRLVIDAGVRVGNRSAGDWLPAWHLLGSPPDAVIVTHAHMDHTGGMTAALVACGDAPWHMTEGTRTLIDVAQGGSGGEDEGRPSNDPRALQQLLQRAVIHHYYEPFQPSPKLHPEVWVRFVPNGHILGSAMLVIDAPGERLGWTGDYCVTPTPTAGALSLSTLAALRRERPFDVVVSEGTYGISKHPSPGAERDRLVRLLNRITFNGGKVLIPAFAIGRAQDLVATLRAAKLRGELDRIPIFLDGMVQPVTEAYAELAHVQYPDRGSPLTLLDPSVDIRRLTADDRTRLLRDRDDDPAIVIASSGMLMGGRSVEYARAWAGKKRNAIIISGYQDEESPGRHLLGLRRGQKLRIGDETIVVRCRFSRYHASAHADGRQIQQVLSTLAPRRIGFVHGDMPALASLAGSVARSEVLENGKYFECPPLNERRGQSFQPAGSSVPAQEMKGRVREWWERVRSVPGGPWWQESEILEHIGLANAPLFEQRAALVQISTMSMYFVSSDRGGKRRFRAGSPERVLDGLRELQIAYGLPVKAGDLVVWQEMGQEASLAILLEDQGQEWRALVAGGRRQTVSKTDIRAILDPLSQQVAHRTPAARRAPWIDGLLQEARAASPLPVMTFWHFLDVEAGAAGANWQDLLPAVHHDPENMSTTQRVQLALVLGGQRTWFRLEEGGRFAATRREQLERDWRNYPAAVRVLQGGNVRLVGGDAVLPNGWIGADHFEAINADGELRTISLRMVANDDGIPLVPEVVAAWRLKRQAKKEAQARDQEASGEGAGAPGEAPSSTPCGRRGGKPRRSRRRRSAKKGGAAEAG